MAGPVTIVDHDDGWVAFGLTVLIGGVVALAGGWLAFAALQGFARAPGGALLGLALGLGLIAGTGWYLRRRFGVMRRARPGALIAPHWPLVAGEPVKIAYQRALFDPGCTLRRLSAELKLVETCQTYDHHERRYHTHTTTLWSRSLGDGEARRTPEGLHAVFAFTVPDPDGGCPRHGLDAFKAFFGLGRPRQWHLCVHHDVTGLDDSDSTFTVRIRAGGGAGAPAGEARRKGRRAA